MSILKNIVNFSQSLSNAIGGITPDCSNSHDENYWINRLEYETDDELNHMLKEEGFFNWSIEIDSRYRVIRLLAKTMTDRGR